MATSTKNHETAKRISVSINKLHLDLLNPRHETLSDEAQAIEYLCKEEQALNVAKDITKRGILSPLENIGVIPLDGSLGHFTVVEGNRRVCALKLLKDRNKAPSTEARAILDSLPTDFTVPDEIEVVRFATRDDSRQWISLRHQGAQDGVGIRQWNSIQKSRNDETDSPNKLALAILDRASAARWITDAERGALALTTLTRYLASPVVRAALGLGDNRELRYTHESSEVDAALRRFVRDAIAPDDGSIPPVNSRSRKVDREAYARELTSTGVSPKTPLSTPTTPPPPTPPSRPAKPRGPRSPDMRLYLIPTQFVVTHSDKGLLRLRDELRSIPVDGQVFAVNYLLRAFIERLLVLYAKRHGLHRDRMPDHQLVKVCEEHLATDNTISRNDLKSMRIAHSSEDAAHSLHTLGAAVHAGILPTRAGLIAAWDNWEKALGLMLARL